MCQKTVLFCGPCKFWGVSEANSKTKLQLHLQNRLLDTRIAELVVVECFEQFYVRKLLKNSTKSS